MLDPIFCLILKISSYLQSPVINVLLAMQFVEALKNFSVQNNDFNFDNLYKSSVNCCDDEKIDTPVTR